MSAELETAINRASRAYDVLVKDIEKLEGLDQKAIDKSFKYLGRLLAVAHQRASFAAQIGAFSLDAEEDAPSVTVAFPPFNVPAASIMPPAAVHSPGAAPLERIAGMKSIVQAERANAPVAQRPAPVARAAVDPDDVDFIDG